VGPVALRPLKCGLGYWGLIIFAVLLKLLF